MIEVRREPEPVHAVIPIKRIAAAESIPPVKPAEAVDYEPAAAEVETSETAEVDASESVESTEVEPTEMASSEVTATKVTTAEMATTETAGICGPGQRNHGRNERCGYERDKLIFHDTLLLDGDLLAITEALRKWRS
jgi:hypothetical protein